MPVVVRPQAIFCIPHFSRITVIRNNLNPFENHFLVLVLRKNLNPSLLGPVVIFVFFDPEFLAIMQQGFLLFANNN